MYSYMRFYTLHNYLPAVRFSLTIHGAIFDCTKHFVFCFQVSFFSTSPALSSEDRFPFFMRTIPSDKNQAEAMVEIVKLFNWTYVAAVYEESSYGQLVRARIWYLNSSPALTPPTHPRPFRITMADELKPIIALSSMKTDVFPHDDLGCGPCTQFII